MQYVFHSWQGKLPAWGKLSAVAGHHSFRAVRSWSLRLSALMDSDLAWVNGKRGRQSWCYADAFQRSVKSGAIYYFYHFNLVRVLEATGLNLIVYVIVGCVVVLYLTCMTNTTCWHIPYDNTSQHHFWTLFECSNRIFSGLRCLAFDWYGLQIIQSVMTVVSVVTSVKPRLD